MNRGKTMEFCNHVFWVVVVYFGFVYGLKLSYLLVKLLEL